MLGLFALTLVLTIFTSCEQASKSYEITGIIEIPEDFKMPQGYSLDTVIISDLSRKVIAKAPLLNNQFTLKGSIEEALKVSLSVGTFRGMMILENASYKVSNDGNALHIRGGELNELVYAYKFTEAYQKAVKHLRKVSETAFVGINVNDGTEESKKALKEAQMKHTEANAVIRNIESQHQIAIIEGNYSAHTKLLALEPTTYGIRDFAKYKATVEEIKKGLDANNAYLKTVEASIKRRQANINKAKIYATGNRFTDVSATSIDGKTISLGEVVKKNKYTLIEFWASWCAPCRASFPHLKKVYAEYHKRGFEVYGFSIDTKEKQFLKASEEEDIPWINTVDYSGLKSEGAKAYNVHGVPFTVLIAQDGTIIDSGENIRDAKLDAKLKELFGE